LGWKTDEGIRRTQTRRSSHHCWVAPVGLHWSFDEFP
jgi:hypothetical protein